MTYERRLLGVAGMVLALISVPSVQAESNGLATFNGIEREMLPEDQRATGIDGLSEGQLEALNQWLRQRFNPMQETVSEEVREADAAEREAEIERRVAIEVEAAKQEIQSAPPGTRAVGAL